jgi:hypothetical protein
MGEANASGSGPAPTAGGKHEGSSVRLKRPELRQYPRFRMDETIAQLYIKGFLTKFGLGRKNEARSAVNLSEGGILMLTHSKLNPGTKVQVRIEIEKYHDLIEAEGEVRWCFQSARDATDFYAGVQFKDLPPAHAALIGKMRAWFTSPEYKQKSATRRRLAPPDAQK